MTAFRLRVLSPDGPVFDGEVVQLYLRGADGDLAVLAGHIPFVTSVRPGDCRLLLPDESEKTLSVAGGLLTVGKDAVTLLFSSAESTPG